MKEYILSHTIKKIYDSGIEIESALF